MAGLLDIFGTGGGESLGLLGGDVGQSRNDAQAQALYALAGSLLSGGPTGQSIVKGLQQGSQAYRNTMKGATDEQMQVYQLQEIKRKKEQEEAARVRQQRIDQAVASAYQPAQAAQPAKEIYGEDIMGQQVGEGMTPAIEGRAAGFDLQRLAPALMASPEGRKTLADLMTAQKGLAGETFQLAEGATQYQRDPLTGKVTQVASGAPKQDKGPSSFQEYQLAMKNPEFGQFLNKQKAAAAPKFAVNLSDPTAVAKAQSDVVKDWRSVVKDTGAMEVADRYKSAKSAVDQANAGNKTADGALIYAIGKIYDPSGAVQEGDKATILGNRSIPDTVKAYAERALTGQSLLPAERAGLLSIAKKIVESKAQSLEVQKSPYTSISKQLGGTGDLLLNPFADVLKEGAGMKYDGAKEDRYQAWLKSQGR